jgi:hypothetical protein
MSVLWVQHRPKASDLATFTSPSSRVETAQTLPEALAMWQEGPHFVLIVDHRLQADAYIFGYHLLTAMRQAQADWPLVVGVMTQADLTHWARQQYQGKADIVFPVSEGLASMHAQVREMFERQVRIKGYYPPPQPDE